VGGGPGGGEMMDGEGRRRHEFARIKQLVNI